MAQSEKVLPMDIERLDVVKNGVATISDKEHHGGAAFKYNLFIACKIQSYWVWRSSPNYYFVKINIDDPDEKPKGIEGGPTLNAYFNSLIKTAKSAI